MSLPRLTGARVLLVPASHPVARGVVTHDEPALLAALAAEGLRAGAGWPHEDTADGLRGLAEHGGPGDDGGWLIVLTEGGQVVGDCGRRGGASEPGDRELGYGLAAPFRRQGLAGEAVALMAAWTEREPGVRRLTAEVLAGNEPSLRLLARLGFEPDPVAAAPPYVRLVRPVRTDEPGLATSAARVVRLP